MEAADNGNNVFGAGRLGHSNSWADDPAAIVRRLQLDAIAICGVG
jgi:hypothetical protein